MARDETPTKGRSRRDLLLGVGALAVVAGGWQLWANRAKPFEFAPIEGLPGWRQIGFGGVSGATGGLGGFALVGIDEGGPQVEPLPADALCDALFRETTEGKVPVAAFADFFCPYCRVLTRILAEIIAEDRAPIDVTWHELPLLGPASEIAARAALAAEMQGAYVEFQERLMVGQFRPTSRFLREIADDTGISADQLLRDMESSEIAERLITSRAASLTLGIWGTPALVVGRTLVMGAIPEEALLRLAEFEAEDGPLSC